MRTGQKFAMGVGILMIPLFFLGIYIGIPIGRVAKIHARYERVEPGMNLSEVAKIMARKDAINWKDGPFRAWWNEQALGDTFDQQITKCLRYRVKTFFLPITFEFTFDKNNQLIGKHRYD